jgi:hypothetical protein
MEPPTPSSAITLAFDEFGWGELRAEAGDAGITIEELIERAVEQFSRELSAGARKRPALEVPDASRGEGTEKATSAEVSLRAEQLAALKGEAERQEVPLSRLVEHAVFLYLAGRDVDGEAD